MQLFDLVLETGFHEVFLVNLLIKLVLLLFHVFRLIAQFGEVVDEILVFGSALLDVFLGLSMVTG